ncbi:hypothetical protein B0181_04560 [Moraxella caviae]|uniref:Uncharacterized protein n=1 Tax=Moraxella caviae TaxID=34060 RepID=A0A1T0A4N0_9GAMM|nr:hypothetical protein B0181_04560 [Moraxella caviae]
MPKLRIDMRFWHFYFKGVAINISHQKTWSAFAKICQKICQKFAKSLNDKPLNLNKANHLG